MSALPRFVVLKTTYNDKYLRYRNEDGVTHGFLEVSEEQAISPLAKFEVEVATTGNGRYVHIRSCYSNKYWVRSEANGYYIVAKAEEQEEDQTKWNCTLFEPIFPDASSNTIVRLRLVQLGMNTYPVQANAPYGGCFYAGTAFDGNNTVFDWESFVMLPKYICLKGDNGLYLSSRAVGEDAFLEFDSSYIGDPVVAFEVVTCGDGSVLLKSNHTQRFWMIHFGNYIKAELTDTTCNNVQTKFWAVKVGNNAIALAFRIPSIMNLFCKRYAVGRSYLIASDPTITVHSRLPVEEPVLSREIYNVNFRLADARIYNQSVLDMANAEATNNTSRDNTLTLRLNYTDSRTGSWNGYVSLTLGVTTTFVSKIPFIAEGKIETSYEFTGSYEWGDEWTESRELEATYEVTVPAMTKVTVSLISTRALCDVPFSYVTRDVLYDGTTRIYLVDGGVYTGVNNYNFQYLAEERSLQDDSLLKVHVLKF